MTRLTPTLTAAAAILALAAPALAQEVNIYSSRHYDSDDLLFDEFTEETGITVNRIEADADEIIARLEAEGDNSPADIFIAVDVGRMDRAEEAGVLQPFTSDVIEERVPEQFQHPENLWFGVSQRARIIFYAKDRVETPPVTYEALAEPEWKGKICIRSSSNIYNLSLMGSLIEAHGAEAAEEWAKGVVANMAREPEGGDTDQIKAVAAGQCAVAVANTYYFVRLLTSDDAADRELAEGLQLVFPNQDGRGTHVNVSGAGRAAHAPNPENAVALLEFLSSDEAQGYFANGNNEYPVVEGVAANAAVVELGEFKEDEVNVSVYGRNQPEAQMIMDRAGWK